MSRRPGPVAAAMLIVILMLSGCTRAVDGAARAAAPADNAARFFEGQVETYGFDLSRDELDMLAYEQAIRRIDPCGFVDQERFTEIGEITAMGTLVSFDECGVELRVSGQRETLFLGIGLAFGLPDEPVAFSTGGVPVHDIYPGECVYEMPLALSDLPDAPRAPEWAPPVVRVDAYAADDCRSVRRVVKAVAPLVADLELPLRDGASAYPVALAERNPCEVLSVVTADYWEAGYGDPYQCSFTVEGEDTSNWVTLAPQVFDDEYEGTERIDRDGIELILDEYFCATHAFVGPELMQRSPDGNSSGGATDMRPAVSVESDTLDCEETVELAVAAAKLYT